MPAFPPSSRPFPRVSRTSTLSRKAGKWKSCYKLSIEITKGGAEFPRRLRTGISVPEEATSRRLVNKCNDSPLWLILAALIPRTTTLATLAFVEAKHKLKQDKSYRQF